MGVNDGFFDFITNWYIFFDKLDQMKNVNVLFLCEDDQVYKKLSEQILDDDRVLSVRTNAHKLHSEALEYGTQEYNKFVTTRPSRLISVACSLLGQTGTNNLIYADSDAVWKKNPIPYLEQLMYHNSNNNAEYVIQEDGVDEDGSINHCTGFMGMKVTETVIRFLSLWETSVKSKFVRKGKWSIKHKINVQDQDVFNEIMRSENSSLELQRLSQKWFPNGRQYFEDFNATEREEVAVIHNNWVIGHTTKLERFKNFGLWEFNSSSYGG